MAINRSSWRGELRSPADLRDEAHADRLRKLTYWLRARSWSEDSILLLKVMVTMGGAFLLAYALASILNAFHLGPYILS